MAVDLKYPRGTGTARPYRLWDERAKKHIPHRCFGIKDHAHRAALWECWFVEGACLEVYDTRNGKLLGQYTRKNNRIDFMGV